MSPGQLVVLNPDEHEFAIGVPGTMRVSEARVTFVDLYADETPAQMRLAVTGVAAGPVPEPVQALTVVDRDLPHRPGNPDGRYLDDCFAQLPTHLYADDRLWIPVGWHDGGAVAPRALVARIGDIAAGFCTEDAVHGRAFMDAPLRPDHREGPARPVVHHRGDGSALLLTVAPEVTRVVMSSAPPPVPPDPAQPAEPIQADCTMLDGFAMCTLDARYVLVTVYTPGSPEGIEVYRN
jgi:hypothetical protein